MVLLLPMEVNYLQRMTKIMLRNGDNCNSQGRKVSLLFSDKCYFCDAMTSRFSWSFANAECRMPNKCEKRGWSRRSVVGIKFTKNFRVAVYENSRVTEIANY